MGTSELETLKVAVETLPIAQTESRAGARQALAEQAAALTTADFIQERILPLVRASLPDGYSALSTSMLQNTGTGRLTLRYELAPDVVVIAKMFTDGLGEQSFQATACLWNSGFNRTSRYQVPEPLGFLVDVNLLLMREAPGIPLSAALPGDDGLDITGGCRDAARWLAALHRTSTRFGRVEPDWQSLKLFRMSTRLIKAAALQPEQLDMMLDLFRDVSDCILKLSPSRPMVQTHGRYHHDHVFIAPEATVVIDWDRCCLSDPAKDVAEFVSVLRAAGFRRGLDMARIDEASQAFLQEYLAAVPEAEVSLGAYWAAAALHSLLSGLKKGRSKGDRSWEQMEAFYLQEINHALGIQS